MTLDMSSTYGPVLKAPGGPIGTLTPRRSRLPATSAATRLARPSGEAGPGGPATPHRAPRLEFLDSVRGLAALSVVASHFVLAYGVPPGSRFMNNSPLHIWWDGSAAVSMFFVLSGFVLSLKYFRHTDAPRLDDFTYLGFAAARALRIFVPYLVVLAGSALAARWTAQGLATRPPGSTWLASLWSPASPTVASLL